MRKQNHPLLLRQMAVVMSKLQEFKVIHNVYVIIIAHNNKNGLNETNVYLCQVECAVHNPEPHVNTDSTADLPVMGHGCVWVSRETIYSLNIKFLHIKSVQLPY